MADNFDQLLSSAAAERAINAASALGVTLPAPVTSMAAHPTREIAPQQLAKLATFSLARPLDQAIDPRMVAWQANADRVVRSL